MKMILKENIRDLGQRGDLVTVADGYARNFLLPNKLAVEATKRRVKEFEHLKRVAESLKKKEKKERKDLMSQLVRLQIVFRLNAGEGDKLFGSVTNKHISDELKKQGHIIDKRDISLPEPIKVLGQHKAIVKMDENLEQEIIITVERLNPKD